MGTCFYLARVQDNPIPVSQRRQLRLSSIKKYAKSCPWKVRMPSFEHFPANKGSLQTFRLTHAGGTGLKGTSYLEAWPDVSCVSHTPAWPITNSDISSVQGARPLSGPCEGLKAQQFWRASDNCYCGSFTNHQWLQALPQAAWAGALGNAVRKI